MDVQELFDQNPWWKDKTLIDKDYDLAKWKEKKHAWTPDLVNQINLEPFAFHTLTGPRQAGKTTTLKLLLQKLLETRESRTLFYFNCENLADHKELNEVLQLYMEFRENNNIAQSILLLDEITLPKEWYRAVKSLIDQGKLRNDILIITGSTTLNIKREIELFPGRRGKGKDYILYPLSFRGFLKVFDQKLIEKIPPIHNLEDLNKKTLNTLLYEKELNKHLEKYMEYGGFPLSISNPDKEEAKKTYLSWIKNAILKAGRNDTIARQIIAVLVETIQTETSWENLSKKIEIKSPKTVSAYIDLLKSIYAINPLYKIDINTKKIRFGKNKKIHFRDPLLFDIFEEWSFSRYQNKHAAIAESLAIEHLTRLYPEQVFFWKNGFEIDAILREKNNLYGFEVKWSEKAEAKGLPQLKRFTILTKKEYSQTPTKIPLATFLSLLDV